MGRLRRGALAATLIVLTVLLSGPPAVADSSRCTLSGCAGQARWVSYGEHLHVDDRLADGHSAVAVYWLEGGTGPFHVWNPNGNGSSVDHNLELAEGSWIYYYVCLGEYGLRMVLTSTCSSGVTDYA